MGADRGTDVGSPSAIARGRVDLRRPLARESEASSSGARGAHGRL